MVERGADALAPALRQEFDEAVALDGGFSYGPSDAYWHLQAVRVIGTGVYLPTGSVWVFTDQYGIVSMFATKEAAEAHALETPPHIRIPVYEEYVG